ncbi:MAG TPA: HEPN domain-containing protein [Rhodopila sp.]|uniref:HEPN domain-containing protein n=1 Tax=Rhodopila sp. TaxID=2480087 RepID=UPI002B9413D4|nr:HEPN domain-containing protein [Rhodopila sp.]HVY17740.1 HEPN domain-containing protein [Rhodopila sp.]
MTPETALFLAKAHRLLGEAKGVLAAGYTEAAGRAAYLAGFHAAQALIFERTGRMVKTHKGVRTEFHRLTRDEPGIDHRLRGFLGVAYNLKTIADYETGGNSDVSADEVRTAANEAEAFVATIEGILSGP